MQFKIKNWQIQNEALVLGVVRKFKDWDYEIKEIKKDRTTQQNRYLRWWVYKTIADEIWEDKDYVHWFLTYKFLLDKSKKAPYIKSTTKLNIEEFTKYIENIRIYVANYWITIPTSEEYFLYFTK